MIQQLKTIVLVVTGDVNFSKNNGLFMSSKICYEKKLFGKLIELSFSKFNNDQLELVLCNNLDWLIKRDY